MHLSIFTAMHPDALLFFEDDYWPNLECVPIGVRYKLDLCSIKVSLRSWQQMSTAEREQLIHLPCGNAEQRDQYRATLDRLANHHGFALVAISADPTPFQEVPCCDIASPVWQQLSPFERFVCAKLYGSKSQAHWLPEVLERRTVEGI